MYSWNLLIWESSLLQVILNLLNRKIEKQWSLPHSVVQIEWGWYVKEFWKVWFSCKVFHCLLALPHELLFILLNPFQMSLLCEFFRRLTTHHTHNSIRHLSLSIQCDVSQWLLSSSYARHWAKGSLQWSDTCWSDTCSSPAQESELPKGRGHTVNLSIPRNV